MRRVGVAATVFLSALPVTGVQAQSGGYLVKLGADTVAVEQYFRSAGRIQGILVRRLPSTLVVRYQMTLKADGSVATFEQSAGHADGSPAPNAPPAGRMTFANDTVVREVLGSGTPNVARLAAPPGTVPVVSQSWLSYQLQLEAARRNGAAFTVAVATQQQAATKVDLRFFDPDSAEITAGGFTTGFKTDASGRLVRGDATGTTQKFIAVRDANIDPLTIARAWEERDAAGGAFGVASPRDTVNATIGGARLMIDYGRPAKRGRGIWGGLVPFDTTWRFGANAATQLRTDADFDLGGVVVPAGFYSLWMFPTADRAWLIVNSQTGQWGTQYDSTRNVARVPLTNVGELPNVEERFRVFVESDTLKMLWDRSGYAVKISKR